MPSQTVTNSDGHTFLVYEAVVQPGIAIPLGTNTAGFAVGANAGEMYSILMQSVCVVENQVI